MNNISYDQEGTVYYRAKNRDKIRFLQVFAILFAFALYLPVTLAATFSNLDLNDTTFDPSTGTLDISYHLDSPDMTSNVTVSIYNATDLNNPVKTWTFNSQATGNNMVTWDAKNNQGMTVVNGNYMVRLSGVTANGSVIANQGKTFSVETTVQVGLCANFTDVLASDERCTAIAYVKSIGAMTGNPNGTFAQNTFVQRDEIAKIVLETFGEFDGNANYCNNVNPFPDVTPGDWSYQYICRGKNTGMITGYKAGPMAGNYMPERNVSRVELLALLLRNLSDPMPTQLTPNFSDIDYSQWYAKYAKYAYDNDLFARPYLYPPTYALRGEVADVIYKLHTMGKI